MDVLIESEMQQMEADDSPCLGENVRWSNEDWEKTRSVIDMDFGVDESVDLDENDNKSLLSGRLTSTAIGE